MYKLSELVRVQMYTFAATRRPLRMGIAENARAVSQFHSRWNRGVLVYPGRTVHVVPAEDGGWTVVDLQRRGSNFRSKSDALDYARRIACANPPSQVVLFTATGGMETAAHCQLPEYQNPQAVAEGDSGSLFETPP